MRKKIVWLVVSCLMVLALLATSCAKAEEKAPAPVAKEAAPVVKEAAPVVKEAAPAAGAEMVKVTLTKVDGTVVEKLVEKPRYGGTLIIPRRPAILAWDEAYQAPWTLASSLTSTNQDLVMGSWYRGPAGTGEVPWTYGDWPSLKYVAGELAESWEFPEPGTVIYHIRKGVRWHNKPPVNGREFTADDVVFNLKRIYFDIKTATMYGMLGAARPTEVYATDKYTVVMKGPVGFIGQTFEQVSDLTKMFPPEVIQKYGDHNKWENVTGTGPFMLVDYVPMSSATWVRNPNYWEYDPVLGKDYPLPYVDTLKTLIIPDLSTQLAAMRTGKVEVFTSTKEDFDGLMKSRPDLQYTRVPAAGYEALGFRLDKPELPFDDIRVRKALIMGVNFREMVDTYFMGDTEVITYKIPPHPEVRAWYTPYEQLPPQIKEIYTYNPEKAKQLLTEAGYPNGFKTEVVYDPVTYVVYSDLGAMAKAYWAKIGVDLMLDPKETGTFFSVYQRKTHKEGLLCGRSRVHTSMYCVRKGNMYNWAMIDDPKMDDYYYPEVWKNYLDTPTRDKLMKEMNLYVLSQAWYVPFPRAASYNLWQPWLKNYHGANAIGIYSSGNEWRYLWLDQELKKAMGR